MNPTAPAAREAPAPCPSRPPVARRAGVPRRLLRAAAVVLVIGGSAAPVRAGPPASDGRNVMRVEVAIDPARASGAHLPRAIALTLSASYRAVGGGAGEPFYRQGIDTPGPLVVKRGRAISRCRLSDFGLRGERACPKGSRVGSGAAVFDGRSASLPEELRAPLRLYNVLFDVNLPRGFAPIPEIIAVLAGGAVKGYLSVAVPWCCAGFFAVNGVSVSPAVPLTDVTLRIRRMVGRRGQPYLAAPRTCRGSWRFRFHTRFERASSRSLVAVDDVSCRPA